MLTAAQCRDAKAREKPYELTCSALPGFLLRVLPTGKKAFFVRYRVDGKDRRERLGLMGADFTVEEARRMALRVLSGEGGERERGREAGAMARSARRRRGGGAGRVARKGRGGLRARRSRRCNRWLR